jgi:hypothetical protein
VGLDECPAHDTASDDVDAEIHQIRLGFQIEKRYIRKRNSHRRRGRSTKRSFHRKKEKEKKKEKNLLQYASQRRRRSTLHRIIRQREVAKQKDNNEPTGQKEPWAFHELDGH